MAQRSALRASDLDREQVAERLRHATAEGRLLASELEERLGTAFSARTYGELDPLVADLPAARERARPDTPFVMRAALAAALVMAALAVIALFVLLFIGLAGTWAAFMAVIWLMFGRGRCGRAGYSRRSVAAYQGRISRTRSPRGGHTASL